MGRVAGILADAIIVILLLLVVAFAGVRLVGLTPYAVLSGSMEPQFPVGSLIYVRDADPASIQPGDAVTFTKSSGVIATHQAYEVDTEQQLIRTQGIANKNGDGTIMQDAEPVPFSNVIGVPVACIPLLGYVNTFVTSAPGMIVVAAVAVAAVAATFISNQKSREPVPEPARPSGGAHMRRQ